MKTKLFLFLIAAFLVAACSKKDDASPQPEPITPPTTLIGESNTVYFVDTFRVYSTNLSGGNRKLLIDEDLKSGNNYINTLSVMPGSNKLVYVYSTGYLNPVVLKIANSDGTNIKTIKTFAAGTNINFLKAIAGNKIYYGKSITVGGAIAFNLFVINEDGTNETEMKGLPTSFFTHDAEISNQGIGYLSTSANPGTPNSPSMISCYLVKIKNGVFAESESKVVLSGILADDVAINPILSNDITKIAYATKTAVANKLEIKVKDIASATAVTVYTLTLPTEISYTDVELYWVSGTQKLLAYYGKFTSPKGAVTDYTACELIDVAKGTASNWKFIGDDTQIIVN